MTIKKIAVTSSMVLALGLSLPLFAASHEAKEKVQDGDALTIECIPQLEADAMEQADREKLTIPICEDVDEGMKKEDAAEKQ